jgi:dTDP-glucose 4,6-dehydratase
MNTLSPNEILARDIQAILAAPGIDWTALRAGKLLITGGTGFIGHWLVETLTTANRVLALDLQLDLVTRNAATFARRRPHLAENPAVRIIESDVRKLRRHTPYTHIVHAAADASAQLNENAPYTVFQTIVHGMENILDIAQAKKVAKVLFLSSGAVYGQQPPECTHVPEEATFGPDPQNPRNTYAEAKRAAEMLGSIYRAQYALDVVSARIFSLLGPLLPLDIHFAAGNFIRDALRGDVLRVHGDGRPVRSYLYPGDLVHALLLLLTRPTRHTAYNLGSEHALSIAELAQRIADLIGNGRITIAQKSDPGWNAGRYVPDTRRIREEFGFTPRISLEKAILRTALWHGHTTGSTPCPA